MAHFYASIRGNGGEASRMGSAGSGIEGHIRGWHIGARVYCYVDEQGNDCVSVSITSGSSCRQSEKDLGTFTRKNHKIIKRRA